MKSIRRLVDGRTVAVALAITPSALLLADVRHTIESQMLLHMLLEFPLLLVSGAAAGLLTLLHGKALARAVEKIDYQGFTAATLLLCVSAYWMIPASLDSTLLRPDVAFWKYVSWWSAGWMLALSWRRMNEVLVVFLLGNLCWMYGAVGLMYQSSESRLCVNYLFGDQQTTGRALVVLAVGLAGVLAHRVYRSSRLLDAAT